MQKDQREAGLGRLQFRARRKRGAAPRRASHRTVATLALGVVALTAGGCGGGNSGAPRAGTSVDRGGFSTQDRQLANTALATLDGTSLPGTIVQLTATVGLPTVCRVHAVDINAGPKDFDVILAWEPVFRSGNAFTWLQMTVASSGVVASSLHLGTTDSAAALARHYGVGYTLPFDPCQVNAFGDLHAVPLTFAAYPATGKRRKIPLPNTGAATTPCSLCRPAKH